MNSNLAATRARPVVLVLVGHYLPGFKAGGILRSVENLVNHLHREFQFLIVTRDRDLGDEVPYPNIKYDEWQTVGNASVYYLVEGDNSLAELLQIVEITPHDLLYLNSFFEPITVRVLWNRKLHGAQRQPILLSPRGEFAWASLRQKHLKKTLFIWLARLTGLYAPVTWHASSAFEADDIAKVMRVPKRKIQLALDLPTIEGTAVSCAADFVEVPEYTGLRVIFLSRISPEKNLDFALKVLRKVRSRVTFEIVGPVENVEYWEKCQKLRDELPSHVTTRALGSIKPSEVFRTLAQYDLLFFPSGGENYGHVIAEALTVGTSVLTSTNTPWRNLAARNLGWDLPLDDSISFVRVLDEMALEGGRAKLARRKIVRESMRDFLADPSVLEGNRQLFEMALNRTEYQG